MAALATGCATGAFAYSQIRQIVDRPDSNAMSPHVTWRFAWFHALGLTAPFVVATALAVVSLVLVRNWHQPPRRTLPVWQRMIAAMSVVAFGGEAVAVTVWTATHPTSTPHPSVLLFGLVAGGLTGAVVAALAAWTWFRTPLRPTKAVALVALAALAALVFTPLAASQAKTSWASAWVPVSWDWSYRLVAAPDDATTYGAVQCDAETCITFGSGLDPRLVGLISTDGGMTWADLHSQDLSAESDFVPSSLSCWDSDTDCLAGGGMGPSGPVLMASGDGGRAWAVKEIAGIFPFWVACTAAGHCMAAGNSAARRSSTTESSSALVYTLDGVGTWATGALPGGSWRLGPITCPTASTCFTTGADVTNPAHPSFSLLASDDGGRSWTARRLPLGGAPQIGALSCADAQHCVIEAFNPDNRRNFDTNGTLESLSTADGGHSWTLTAVTRDALTGPLACTANQRCLLVAEDNNTGNETIYASSNDGHTWHPAAPLQPSNLSISSISCPSLNRCIITGSTGFGPDDGKGIILLGNTTGTRWQPTHTARN